MRGAVTADGREAVLAVEADLPPSVARLDTTQWSGRMTDEDMRGLTPLIYNHVNPYGRFELDMSKRLPLAETTHTM